MMTETVVTVQDAPPNASPRQGPTVKTESGQPNIFSEITINAEYFKTIPGIIKLVQLILGIICMSCASPAYYGANQWFLFVAVTAFIASLIWTFVYFLSIREALKVPINWILTELLNTSLETLLYTTAFIAQFTTVAFHFTRGGYIAAAVFGLFNTIAYAAGAYFLYIEWKNSRAQ